ncbi:MAG: (Fe-S)-binding protein [SAR324 cluster bacterium]|nr:(Fe-S)-binding protein [SAR324 cluster bacterium]
MGNFDYRKHFGEIQPLADALREGEERCWQSATGRDPEPRDYVLWLGCNVLRTVNLAESIVAILEAMGVDFVALGGPANCCGIVHHRNDDFTQSSAMVRHTWRNFTAYRPKAVLTYCPSCHFHMDELQPPSFGYDTPYLHVTGFIAERLERLKFVKPVRRKVALHAHDAQPQQGKDGEATLKILRAIPGLEVAELRDGADWGRHCYPVHIQQLGRERFDAMVDEMFRGAQAAGFDAIATVYHSCYREHCAKGARYGVELVNYVDLVTEALGIGPFRESYKELALAGDPEGAFEALRPRAEARQVNLKKLREATQTHFPPRGK